MAHFLAGADKLTAEERRLSNFVDFIGEGRGSRALAEALAASERKVEELREEIDGLRASSESVFQAPPVEWIEERLTQLRDVLERRTEKSALLLRKVLGPVRLDPSRPEEGKPYYMARTDLNTLAVLDPPPGDEPRDSGSNSLRWWTRTQRIRTVAAVPLSVPLFETSPRPIYQEIALKARHLKRLGLNYAAIARRLGIMGKAASLLYKVIDSRTKKRSTAFFTNVDFEDWKDYLPDAPLAYDRQDHVSHVSKEAGQREIIVEAIIDGRDLFW